MTLETKQSKPKYNNWNWIAYVYGLSIQIKLLFKFILPLVHTDSIKFFDKFNYLVFITFLINKKKTGLLLNIAQSY
jgi:hypothetical protein